VRHAQYKTDAMLQAMHARCPWFVTWDDHEVENNYANDVSERLDAVPAEFLVQRAAAYRAYYEAMPLRRASLPQGPAMQLYRRASFGRLAEFAVLDTRQYRTDQPNGDGKKHLNAAARDPSNTQLGARQREWLERGLAESPATWNVLAQQVMMGVVGFPPPRPKAAPAGDGASKQPAAAEAAYDANDRRYSMDQWPGYLHERVELVRFLEQKKVANPIVLTGDIHSSWVNELRVDDLDERSPIVATEFVGTSISSEGDGRDAAAELAELQPHNPGVRFLDRRHGYVACTVTPREWRSDYRTVDAVTKPDARVRTAASFVVHAGRAGVVRV
jgi:alkaline phosphatase D